MGVCSGRHHVYCLSACHQWRGVALLHFEFDLESQECVSLRNYWGLLTFFYCRHLCIHTYSALWLNYSITVSCNCCRLFIGYCFVK